MDITDHSEADSEVLSLEERVSSAPFLVADCLRLAHLLEKKGDLKAAAALYQRAHFFLPNSAAILDGLGRLSEWIESTQAPIMVTRARSIEADDDEAVQELRLPEPEPEPEPTVDEIDALIQGLETRGFGRTPAAETAMESEWAEDDGLIATETLAQIYASQSQFEEAMFVYNRLAESEKDPDRAARLREKAAAMSARVRDASS